ncbi:MAG: pyridoxamine 5'-phosphate oxidase family protein [Lentisphaerae bacterium]|nr:pyridoxamine 5'-phosphate oxidase family protein [Lentisphaerota bacterium]MCP4101433.1 pyridoxamine 5'-phosphate oxidase family protein [Lentisphaerota bacterium]
MRRRIQEITDPIELDDVLSSAKICRVAMMDGDKPYIIPFNYGYKDKSIYIHCALQGKKLDLLNNHHHVCFEVEDSVKVIKEKELGRCSTRYRSIIGYGDVEIIMDDHERMNEALKILMGQHDWGSPVDYGLESVKRLVILKLKITEMTGKRSSNWNKTSEH